MLAAAIASGPGGVQVAVCTDKEFVLDYFAVAAVVALKEAGVELAHSQIYRP